MRRSDSTSIVRLGRSRLRRAAAGLLLASGATLAAVLPAAASARASSTARSTSHSTGTIVVGSEGFDEDNLLADVYAQALQHAGISASVHAPATSRQTAIPALEHGALDLVPEYAGTLALYLDSGLGSKANALSTAVPELKTLLGRYGATVLTAAPAEDTNVFAVTQATKAKYHLTSLSSLKPYASQLVLGGPAECPINATCELGLEKVYGLHFKSFVTTDESGPISVAALKTDRAQVVEFFSSDGAIQSNDFYELNDNKHMQAADYVIPVIRKRFDTPAVAAALDKVQKKLTTSALAGMDTEANDHVALATVASRWLAKAGLG